MTKTQEAQLLTDVGRIAKALERIAHIATTSDEDDDDNVQCSTCDRVIISAEEAFVRDKDDDLHCVECALKNGTLFKKKTG